MEDVIKYINDKFEDDMKSRPSFYKNYYEDYRKKVIALFKTIFESDYVDKLTPDKTIISLMKLDKLRLIIISRLYRRNFKY